LRNFKVKKVVNQAAKYRRDKEIRTVRNLMTRAIDEGSKTIKVTEFVTVSEIVS
jgi:hypothetical protein